jgi:arylsulfatase A-like enzyme/Tfp pilus assembly protein PilF
MGLAVLLAAILLSLGEAGGDPGAPPVRSAGKGAPSLLVVTIDTWRWDYIGASGSGKVATPALDRLAREGVYEAEAVTPCPLTTPAHASLFTGLDPMHHKLWDCTSYRLDAGARTLAQALREKGFRTAAFVAGDTLKRRYGLDRGFDFYDDSGMDARSRGDWMSASRDGKAVTDAVLAHLKGAPPGGRLFVWAHYFDLHLPYRPRPGLDERYPKDPYAAQAAYVDGQVARLVAALNSDLGRSWRIVVVGDHGEGLGEKGEDTHGMGLYRATLHVPLIFWPKPEKPLAHAKPWGLVDLSPTLLAWFGLEGRPGADGEDLFRAGRADRILTAVTVEPTLMFGVTPFTGIRKGPHLYLRDGSEELYNLGADPRQARNLAKGGGVRPTLDPLRKLADRAWPPGWVQSALPPTLSASVQEMKDLQGLGYIGGPAPAAGSLKRASAAQVLADRSAWDRAREAAYRTKRGDDLLALYPRLVASYPSSGPLHKAYGTLLAQAGKAPEAIRELEQAVRLNARDGGSLTNLGGLYIQTGKPGPARVCLQKALELDPRDAIAHQNLGVLYAEILKDPSRAAEHYRAFLRLDPTSPDAPAARAFLAKFESRKGAAR